MACEGGACGTRGVMFSSDVDFTQNNAFQTTGGNTAPPALQTTNQCGQGVVLEGRYKQMTVSCPTRTPYTYKVQVPKKTFRAVPVQSHETIMTTEQKLVPFVERQQRVRKVKRKVRKPVVKWEDHTEIVPVLETRDVRKRMPITIQKPTYRTRTNFVTQEQTHMTTELRTGYKQGSKPCVVNVPEYTAKCSGVVTTDGLVSRELGQPMEATPWRPGQPMEATPWRPAQPMAATPWRPEPQTETKEPEPEPRRRPGVEDHQTKFSELDTNGDGMISREELQAAGGLGFQ